MNGVSNFDLGHLKLHVCICEVSNPHSYSHLCHLELCHMYKKAWFKVTLRVMLCINWHMNGVSNFDLGHLKLHVCICEVSNPHSYSHLCHLEVFICTKEKACFKVTLRVTLCIKYHMKSCNLIETSLD